MTACRLAATLAAAAIALGCGGSDGESFEDGYRAESREIEAVGGDIARTLTAAPRRSSARLARQMRTLARRAEGSVRDLEQLDPPEDLAGERDELTRALSKGAADLRAIASAARARNAARARAATRKLIDDSRHIRNARGHLDRLVETN